MNTSSGFDEWISQYGVLSITSHLKGMSAPRDVSLDAEGRKVFVNTQYSCLSTTDGPFWNPFFITELVPEDRCHLNGLAMRDGKPAFVSAFAETNHRRPFNEGDGIIIDVERNEIICRGLTMPHSPRWHDGKLWLLNSGTAELGTVEDGAFHPVAFVAGFLRGLTFVDHFALVGVSRVRFHYDGPKGEPCGVYVIDTQPGELVHRHLLDEPCEIYDVAIIPHALEKAA